MSTALAEALAAVEALALARIESREAAAIHHPDPRCRLDGLRAAGRSSGTATSSLPLDPFLADDRLGALVQDFQLDALDATLLVAALAPSIDDRFVGLYRLLGVAGGGGVGGGSGPAPGRGLTLDVARTLCGSTVDERLEVERRLGAGGRLASIEVIDLDVRGAAVEVGIEPDVRRWLCRLPADVASGVGHGRLPAATPMTTVHELDDLVVPTTVRRQLDGVLTRIANERQVIDDWGYGQRFDNVRGTLVLFHGPPGTGKTMTAQLSSQQVDRTPTSTGSTSR